MLSLLLETTFVILAIPFPLRHPSFHYIKAQNGLVHNRKTCFYRGAPHMGQKCTTPKCPLCPLMDGTSHILGECTHPQMVAHRISRHNGAVLILFKALMKGCLAGFVTIMDATAKADLPEGCEDTRIPEWVLPNVPQDLRAKMRPDLMVIKNLKPDDQEEFQKLRGLARKTAQSKLEVHLFEVGYASNYRLDELFEEKKEQHAALVRALTQEGWKVVYPKEHIVALGTANHVRLETKQLLQQWLPHDSHTVEATVTKLSRHATKKCIDHIVTRRILEKGDKAGNTQGNKGRR